MTDTTEEASGSEGGPPEHGEHGTDDKGDVGMFQSALDHLDYFITRRPLTVIAVFLVLTIFFVGGIGQITTETGTDDFTEDTPAFEALEEISDDFETGFGAGSGSTQLIQRGENTLSKQGVLRMLRAQNQARKRRRLARRVDRERRALRGAEHRPRSDDAGGAGACRRGRDRTRGA